MGYSTQANVETRLSTEKVRQLTDDNRDGEVDAQVVTDAIAAADSTIDGYLGQNYNVPLTTPAPSVIIGCSISIACYLLFARRAIPTPDIVQKLYDNAIAFLTAVSKGEAVVPGIDQASNFACDRDYKEDRTFRIDWAEGADEEEQTGTFTTFDTPFRP